MRKRYRWDKDLEALIEVGSGNYFEEKGQAPSVISDDLKAGVEGLKHIPSGKMIDSKSGHYRENKARGLEHVGNETNFAVKQAKPSLNYYEGQVNDTIQQIEGNWNGTADRLARQREQQRR